MKTLELASFRRECRRSRERGEKCSIEPLNLVQPPLAWSVIRTSGPSELVLVELVLCVLAARRPHELAGRRPHEHIVQQPHRLRAGSTASL